MFNRLYKLCFLLLLVSLGHSQIGVLTTTPASSLDVNGSVAFSLRGFSASTAASITDQVLVFTGNSAATLTLPDASGCPGRIYWIKMASSSNPVPVLTLATTSSQTIDGNAGWQLDEPYEIVRIMSDGSNWVVFSQGVAVPSSGQTGNSWNQGGNSVKALKTIGTNTNYDFLIGTNASQRLRLTTTGYLGLGSGTPSGLLHVKNENDDNGNDYIFNDHGNTITTGLFLRKHRNTVATPLNLQLGDHIGRFLFTPRYNGSVVLDNGAGLDAWYQGNGTTAASDLRFFNSGTERFRLNENGQSAIGTSTWDIANPEKLLVNAGNTSSYNLISGKGDIDNYLQFNIQNRSGGSVASSDIVATADNGDESTNYIDLGINSGGYSNSMIPIVNGPDEAYFFSIAGNLKIGNGSPGYDLVIFTNGFNWTNERLRIKASGNVGIGDSLPSEKLTVNGVIAPSVNNTYTLGTSLARWSSVWAVNGTIQTSDARMKKNIQLLDYGTPELMKLRPVRYNWKSDPDDHKKIGLIAQEVKSIIPELVFGDETKQQLGLNYPELVPVLIKTIQQQQETLRHLTRELELLENETGNR